MNSTDLMSTDSPSVQFASKDEMTLFIKDNDDVAIFHLLGQDLRSDAELLNRIAVEMNFPDYFGHGHNALNDCLRDLDWFPASNYVLIVWDADAASSEALKNLRESWEFCAPYWMSPDFCDKFSPKHPVPFHLVLVGEEKNIFPNP